MSLSLTIGPLTPEQIGQVVQALGMAGIPLNGENSQWVKGAPTPMPPPPQPGKAAMPPMPGAVTPAPAQAPTPPPPPPQQPQVAGPQNPKLANVLQLMDGYSRAGHQVAGARKVLTVLGLQRAQDANDEQLDWLAAAFSNHSYTP
jgi:hypothetical protein